MNWTLLLILYVGALAGCAMGFSHFVWFMSAGYGIAVAAIAVFCLVFGAGAQTLTPGLVAGLFVSTAYGLRLGVFLLRRELGNAAYKKVLESKMSSKEPPLAVKAVMWLVLGALYVAETAGLHLRLANAAPDDPVLWIGIAVMVAGAAVEALADKQKSDQKAAHPDRPATKGLFSLVRCPNYFGEMLFWTGCFVAGMTSYAGLGQWALALVGWVCILFVMVDGARRMEKGHAARYGSDPAYLAYADKTPILIPFVPLYHLYRQ